MDTTLQRIRLWAPLTGYYGGLYFTNGLSDEPMRHVGDRVWRSHRRMVAIYGPSQITLVPDSGTTTATEAGAPSAGTPHSTQDAPPPSPTPTPQAEAQEEEVAEPVDLAHRRAPPPRVTPKKKR